MEEKGCLELIALGKRLLGVICELRELAHGSDYEYICDNRMRSTVEGITSTMDEKRVELAKLRGE